MWWCNNSAPAEVRITSNYADDKLLWSAVITSILFLYIWIHKYPYFTLKMNKNQIINTMRKRSRKNSTGGTESNPNSYPEGRHILIPNVQILENQTIHTIFHHGKKISVSKIPRITATNVPAINWASFPELIGKKYKKKWHNNQHHYLNAYYSWVIKTRNTRNNGSENWRK